MNVSPDLRYPAVTPEFRDAIEELNNLGLKTSHARDITTSAINITKWYASRKKTKSPSPTARKSAATSPLSKYNLYLKNTVVNCAIAGKSMKCYIFKVRGDGMVEA